MQAKKRRPALRATLLIYVLILGIVIPADSISLVEITPVADNLTE